MKKMDADQIEKLSLKTESLIESMCSEDRAQKLTELFEKIGAERYFTAPASSQEDYHNCFPGGLAEHNINVVNALFAIDEALGTNLNVESMCVVGLLHDIGKVMNTDFEDFYVVQDEKWKAEKGQTYTRSDGSIYFPTHQRSVWLLSEFGFKLSPEEYQAILLNDGQYLQENKSYAHKTCNLALLLHMADMAAMIKEKQA